MDRRPAAKAMTDSLITEEAMAIVPGTSAIDVGPDIAVRPSGVRPFNGDESRAR
jgi:hypothetical protein